jgi:beta-glucanase (GH16 family)
MMSFRITHIILSIVWSVALALCSSSGHASASAGAVFDDFDGAEGSRPNAGIWDYDPGNPSSANHQLQNYTDSTENIRLDGQGHLVIQAIRSGNGYTSGRLVTRGKVDMRYGRISARIKMPSGQGIWPAFWMLGSDYGNVGWPECGEVDLMELVNVGTRYNVTLHGPQGKSDYLNGSGVRANGPITDLTNDFHVYWMNWQPDSITIGVDDITLGAFTPASLPDGAQWVFNHPMYAVLNVAVGGDWPGPPNDSTPFPATMLVDWFRYAPGVS